MSYWCCDPINQKFSADQVKRMEWVLQNIRSSLIGRTVMIEEVCRPIFKKEFPVIWPHLPDKWTWPDPGPDWKLIVDSLSPNLRRNSRLIEEIRLITNTVPAYRPWAPKNLEKHLKALNRAGRLKRLPSGLSKTVLCCHNQEKR